MPDQSISQKIERQARQAILEHALLRVENALIVAGVLLATYFAPQPFPWWPAWGWAALGLAGIAGLVVSSLTDPEHNRRTVWATRCNRSTIGWRTCFNWPAAWTPIAATRSSNVT